MDGGPVGQTAEGRPRRRRSGPRRTRLDPATARAQLLGAGLELVAEQSLGDTLGHLRINDLAREAGVTSGAFYHYWDGQDAYRADVLDTLLAGARADADPELFGPSGGEATAEEPVEGLRRAVTEAVDSLGPDPGHRLELALWAHDDPAVRPRLLDRARGTDAAWASAIGAFLAPTGRRPAPGWDLSGLATAAVAISDGLRTQALIDPAAITRPGAASRSWPTPALLAVLLLVGATEPGDPAPVPSPPEPSPDDAESGQGRTRLVALGVQAARARPTGNAFDHIRAEDVVGRLGLTIGAFYHYWESQDDYRDDLVDALFAAERYVDPAGLAAYAQRIAEADEFDTAIRDTTSRYWSVAAGHPDNRVQFAFQSLDDPYIAPRHAAWNAELRRGWQTVLETLLERFDRTCRNPLDPALVVLGMSAALDGLIVRHGLDPGDLGPDDEGWTLWGRTCRALVVAGSAPSGDERDLVALAGDAFAPEG